MTGGGGESRPRRAGDPDDADEPTAGTTDEAGEDGDDAGGLLEQVADAVGHLWNVEPDES